MFAPDLPTLTIGLRGIVYGEIHVQGARTDLHSGDYGGAAPNAIEAAAQIIAALKDRDGHIQHSGPLRSRSEACPGRTRGVESLCRSTLKSIAKKRSDPRALTGEPDVPLFERMWARPTLEIHGIREDSRPRARRP